MIIELIAGSVSKCMMDNILSFYFIDFQVVVFVKIEASYI